jgi:hypothetical protein
MRSRASSTKALALVALALALALAFARAASADPPVPPLGAWPPPAACADAAPLADADSAAFCEVKRRCDTLREGASDFWRTWCAVVREGELLRACEPIAPGASKACERQREQLASRCAVQLPATDPELHRWICEQYDSVYGPKPPTTEIAPGRPPQIAPEPPNPPPPSATPPTNPASPDVFAALGARSPFCNYPGRLTPSAREACERSGSIAHQYPIAHYGLDIHVIAGQKLTELAITDVSMSVMQNLGGLIWIATVYLFKGVLMLLEWAFEIPLIADCSGRGASGGCESALPEVSVALRDLHENFLGTPWMLAAFAAAGLWGIWNGLVRQRVAHTFGGLVATVALITAALVIINNPSGTVGQVARISDQASMALLASGGSFSESSVGTFAEAQESLFDALVQRPWCALQFGDVDYCTKARAGKVSVADIWLSFEAGGVEREALYKITKGQEVDNGWQGKSSDAMRELALNIIGLRDGTGVMEPGGEWERRDRARAVQERLKSVVGGGAQGEKVRLQEAGGTYTRLALLVMVVLTQVGAAGVLGWVGVRLVLASIVLLIMLVLVALVMLASALGDAGRKAVGDFVKQFFAAAFAKVLFAILLAILVRVSGILAGLGIGWFAVWLLQFAFWWGIIFYRGRLLAFANLDPAGLGGGGGGGRSGLGLMQMYFGMRAVRDVSSGLRNAATAPVRALRATSARSRQADAKALMKSDKRRVSSRAGNALNFGRKVRRKAAEAKVAQKGFLQNMRSNLRQARQAVQRKLQQDPAQHDRRVRDLEAQERAQTAAQERRANDIAKGEHQMASLKRERGHLVGQQGAYKDQKARYEDAIARADAQIERAQKDHARATGEHAKGAAQLTQTQSDLAAARHERDNYQPPQDLLDELDDLNAQEQAVDRALNSPEMRAAEDTLRRNQGDDEPSAAEKRRWAEDRRDAIERGAAPEEDQQLIDANIDPEDYRNADSEEQERMRRRSAAVMEYDRSVFARLDADELPAHVQSAAVDDARQYDERFPDDIMRERESAREARRKERALRRWR